MDTLLQEGDMRRGTRGLPCTVTGAEELIQRAIIRLSVRRGSFALDPALGSELYKLGACNAASLAATAENFVRQALLPLPEITVNEVRCVRTDDRLRLQMELMIGGEPKYLEVDAG